MITNLRAIMTAAGLSLLLMAQGCSHLDRLALHGSDDRMLGRIASRVPGAPGLEGTGTLRIEYQGRHLDLPFEVRMGRSGLLGIEADLGPGFVPGCGRLAVVSDDKGTAVYSAGQRVDLAAFDSLGPMLRPILVSLFGGGDALAKWLARSGCEPKRRSVCRNMELGFTLDRSRGAVERWTVRDPVRGLLFNGYVAAWDSRGEGAWATGGMLHPYELAISVRYARLGPTTGDEVAGAGNFMNTMWLE